MRVKNCADKIFNNYIKNDNVGEKEISRFCPIIGFIIEIIIELIGVCIVYYAMSKLAYVIIGEDFRGDFLYALIFLPIISILKSAPSVFQSCFVRVGVGEEFIICKTGYIRKFVDKLYIKNIDNIEVYTNIWGDWFNYGSMTLYSFGGTIHLPFLKNPYETYEFLRKKINDKKQIEINEKNKTGSPI